MVYMIQRLTASQFNNPNWELSTIDTSVFDKYVHRVEKFRVLNDEGSDELVFLGSRRYFLNSESYTGLSPMIR